MYVLSTIITETILGIYHSVGWLIFQQLLIMDNPETRVALEARHRKKIIKQQPNTECQNDNPHASKAQEVNPGDTRRVNRYTNTSLIKKQNSSVDDRFQVKTTEVRRVHVHLCLLVVTSNQNASNKKRNRLNIYPKPGMSHCIPCLIAE